MGQLADEGTAWAVPLPLWLDSAAIAAHQHYLFRKSGAVAPHSLGFGSN
jgi:hypothetical protein